MITPNKHKGFTLVEAMVAISILSLSITGPLVIAQKSIQSAIYARDQITSYYLAQEAVEYVRNARDTNRIKNLPWLTGLSNCLGGNKCVIDAAYTDYTVLDAVTKCTNGVCDPLKFDSLNGFYGYDYGQGGTWTTTIFTRDISIDNTVSSKEAEVTVTISWKTNLFAATKTFTVKEHVFDF